MVKVWGVRGAVALGVMSLAGCGGTSLGNGPGMNVFLGAPATAAADPLAPPALPAVPVAMGSFLEGSVGSKLSETDRATAFKAVGEALDSGSRQTWRGSKGVFGYVLPGGPDLASPSSASNGAPAGECRAFTETIFLAGRPQTGHGTGCKTPDGSWRVIS
jgi:surface antigen